MGCWISSLVRDRSSFIRFWTMFRPWDFSWDSEIVLGRYSFSTFCCFLIKNLANIVWNSSGLGFSGSKFQNQTLLLQIHLLLCFICSLTIDLTSKNLSSNPHLPFKLIVFFCCLLSKLIFSIIIPLSIFALILLSDLSKDLSNLVSKIY